MRIVIDLQACQTTGSRNQIVGRHSLALTQAMARMAGGHEVWLTLSNRFPETIIPIRQAFDGLIDPDRIVVFDLPSPLAESNPENAWRTRAAEYIREAAVAHLKPDVHHLSSLFEGLVDDAATSVNLLGLNAATAVTLYDLIPLIKQDHYLQDSRVRAWYYRKLESLKKANLLLSISDYSRREALSALALPGERVVNISAAIDSHFQPVTLTATQTQTLQARYGLSRPFVLYTGGIDYRKNIEGLIQAYAQLPPETRQAHQLAIVCSVSPEDKTRLVALAQAQGLASDEVLFTGYVPDEDLVLLYNLCHLFVFPSLYEGFGLPALEAMACGAAVIGSDSSSIPEVIGRQDALFDPTDPAAISQTIYHALTDEGFLQSLRHHALQQAPRFSWQASAQKALQAFEALHDQQQHSQQVSVAVSSFRPRLAYVSPLPPEQSGIADYSAELLPELARFYDITLVVSQPRVEDPWLTANLPVKDVAWFKAHAGEFDRILYHFGNSAFHCHMFELLEQFPGVVVLHDFYLGHLVGCLDVFTSTVKAANSDLFRSELYYSHGYSALLMLKEKGAELTIWTYPCNKTVLDQATGVIVHSRYAKDVANLYYGQHIAQDWLIVPQLYNLPGDIDHLAARLQLNFAEDDFLVCSFGMLGPTKLNHRLLSAWLASSLAQDPRCHLIFVGKNDEGTYGQDLLAKIQQANLEDRIHITGFINSEQYRHYLAAANIAVQLRTLSRGETSRSVLETMAHGLPLIVNAHGPVTEYPDDILIKLSDHFSDVELTTQLERLHQNSQLRHHLSKIGIDYISTHHSPREIFHQYQNAIENIEKNSSYSLYQTTLKAIGSIDTLLEIGKSDLPTAATAIAANTPVARQRQLLVDISALVQQDLKTGIQRVVRSILIHLLNLQPENYRVEPVYFDGRGYRYARKFSSLFIGIEDLDLEDSLIEVQKEDIFLGLDLYWYINTVNEFRKIGMKVYFIVYDILPITYPHWFPPDLSPLFQEWLITISKFSNSLICISATVAKEVKSWLDNHYSSINNLPEVKSFRLGADIKSSVPSYGLPESAGKVLSAFKSKPSFLMVGTLEPRKGHAQVLSAFELLWQEGLELNLVIVGKQGWMVDQLVDRLKDHPQMDKFLFWLQGITDEYLEQVYAHGTALIVASEGEGFGLPLIEAAQNKLPIIARDLPVFRELAGENIFYFSAEKPGDLSKAIKTWLLQKDKQKIPNSSNIQYLTWEESAKELIKIIFE